MVDQCTSGTNHSIHIDQNLELGIRIECALHYGTVKYIGEVSGYSGLWLGIDWDNPSRGKHNGTVNDQEYFQSSHPTSGSFIRPGKVHFGKDAHSAIITRYGRKEDREEQMRLKKELQDVQREMNAPFLQMVGFEKVNEIQSNFQHLRVVSLRLQFVNGPGTVGQLAETCPNITELDLSKNLLSKWEDIFSICTELKYLHWLNVSENLLVMPENNTTIKFPHIRTLICGFMRLSWEDILQLTNIFTNTKELRAPFNKICTINLPPEHHLQNLKLLDLEGNELSDWCEINKLGVLLNLEQLNVTNTSIKSISIENIDEIEPFKNLKQLIISENLIDNWDSISELNKLKQLEGLRFIKNPILDTENLATCYQFIIARIGTLNVLNGTTIKSEDRKGAEYDYIKKHGKEWLAVKDKEELKAEFFKRHPRYLEIITKYGELEESELESKASNLKSSLTCVEIHSDSKVVSKKLPTTMTVQKLIMLVQKLFNLPERPVLVYRSSERPDMIIEFDDEFKEIGFYAIKNGDKIYVT